MIQHLYFPTLALIILIIVAPPALSEQDLEYDANSPFQICQSKNIQGGVFRMLDIFKENKHNPFEYERNLDGVNSQPYQFFAFGKNGSFHHIIKNAPVSNNEILDHLNRSPAPEGTYTIDHTVITVKYPSRAGYYICTSVVGDSGEQDEKNGVFYEKGDMLISDNDIETTDGETVVIRRLRRIGTMSE